MERVEFTTTNARTFTAWVKDINLCADTNITTKHTKFYVMLGLYENEHSDCYHEVTQDTYNFLSKKLDYSFSTLRKKKTL